MFKTKKAAIILRLLLDFLVIRLGLEPRTPTLKVLSLKTFKSLAYSSTFKGNLLSKRILQLSITVLFLSSIYLVVYTTVYTFANTNIDSTLN